MRLRHVIYGPPNDERARLVLLDTTMTVPLDGTPIAYEFNDPDRQHSFIVVDSVTLLDPPPDGKIQLTVTENENGDWHVSCAGTMMRVDYEADFTTREKAVDAAVEHVQRCHVRWII